MQDDDSENSKLLESNERRQSRVRSRGSRNETPIFLRNLDSPSHGHGSPLAIENTIARRIDFASPSFAPGQDRAADLNDSSVFSPGLSPVARGILSQLKRSSNKRPSQDKSSTTRLLSDQHTPESCSPQKRPRWTRLIR